jgi:hypothetical protein
MSLDDFIAGPASTMRSALAATGWWGRRNPPFRHLVFVLEAALGAGAKRNGEKDVAPKHNRSSGEGESDALPNWQWYALWCILFLNTCAGIFVISQASPMAQEMTHVTATAATGLVALISIANGSGRLLWAWLSDFPGRRQVFLTMFPPPSGRTDTTRIPPRQPQSAGRTL